MSWSISDLFPPWGDTGERPADNFQYDGGDQVNEKHLDYLWNQVNALESEVRSALTDLDSDKDGTVDEADSALAYKGNDIDSDGDGKVDSADSADDATNVTSTYKGNDIDSDGDGTVDAADNVTSTYKGNDIDTDGDGAVNNSDQLEGNDTSQVRNHTPNNHASRHSSGGVDEIDASNLAGQGSGNGFDADTVDGSHASSFAQQYPILDPTPEQSFTSRVDPQHAKLIDDSINVPQLWMPTYTVDESSSDITVGFDSGGDPYVDAGNGAGNVGGFRSQMWLTITGGDSMGTIDITFTNVDRDPNTNNFETVVGITDVDPSVGDWANSGDGVVVERDDFVVVSGGNTNRSTHNIDWSGTVDIRITCDGNEAVLYADGVQKASFTSGVPSGDFGWGIQAKSNDQNNVWRLTYENVELR